MAVVRSFAMSAVCVVVVLAVSILTVSDAQGCRTKYPGYLINNNYDAMVQGCYHSSLANPVFPRDSLVNFRRQIDWDAWASAGDARDMVQKCGSEAVAKGVVYFGVEFYGECYFGNAPDFSQGQVTGSDGCKNLCKWDVGGANAVMVYKVKPRTVNLDCPPFNVGYSLDNKRWALNRGCFLNGGGILPRSSYVDLRRHIDWYRFHNTGHAQSMIQKCGLQALENNVTYFGIEFFKDCYFGSKNDYSQNKPRTARDCGSCYWDIGQKGSIMIYEISVA